MVIASDFSGLAYLAILVIFGAIVGGAAWLALVWWGTAWLIRKQATRIVTGILGIFPLLIAAGGVFGYRGISGYGLSAWLLATWMLVVARVISLLLTPLTQSAGSAHSDRE